MVSKLVGANAMSKNRQDKFLIFAVVVCLSVIFVALVLPIMVFPLEVNLSGHVVHVGDKISGTVTIVNKSGFDVNVQSNGQQPCIYFQNIMDRNNHAEILLFTSRVLKAGDKMMHDFEYEVTEPGIYYLDAHYSIRVNNYPIFTMRPYIIIVL